MRQSKWYIPAAI